MDHGTIHIGRGTIGFARHMNHAPVHMMVFVIHMNHFGMQMNQFPIH
jgi:hypothetical protein